MSEHCQWRIAIVGVLLPLLLATTQAEEKLPTVRHVFVPADNPKIWPKGDRELVPFEEYLELQKANQPVRSERRGAQIAWQSLSATFDPSRGVLTEGRWEAEVRGSDQQQRLLSLEPLDLPISELKWSDGDAAWGTAPSGETLLLVDAAERKLEGRFSRQGRRLKQTWQFDVSLARATVSELTLRVPTKYSLTCSAATIRGPLTTGEEGWRLWKLNLGSQSRCEILVVESQTTAPTAPVVVYEQTTSYVLREAEIEVQCEIDAEVFHTPKATLEFIVPDDLSVYTVRFAGDSRLPWRELPRVTGQPRQIEVLLPEPQIGRVRALHLLGGVASKWQPGFTLPRIALTNGWFTTGRWNVSVDAPLVWRTLRPVGLRLTEVNATSPTTRRLIFTQFLADASLGIDITSPETRLTSHGLQRLGARETTWRLTSEWLWQSNTGVAFGARCRIPLGWEVLDVQSLPESASSEIRHWDVIKDAAGEQVLVMDFVTPLEGAATHRIQVLSRRMRAIAAERDAFELPTPLDCGHAEQLLIVHPPANWRWDTSNNEAIPAPTAMKRLGSPWLDFELWKEDSPQWTIATLLQRTTQIEAPARLLAAFVPSIAPPPSTPSSPAPVIVPSAPATPASDDPVTSSVAFREAATEQLVWTSAELRSLIFPGGDGDDVHLLSLRAAQVARVGQLEFDLPGPAELASVRMNGVRAEARREGSRFRLPTIPQGGLQTLEIQYRIPSDRDFLRNRQTIPVPRVDAPVLGFRWLFAFPPEARLTEEPNGLRLLQPLEPTPWSRRFFGPLGRDDSEWFNPFSSAAWSELWEPSQPSLNEENTLETLFAPPGWRVREAIAATLPSEISWLTWSGVQVRVLAWIGMLLSISVGCLLRVRRAKPRVHIAAFWMGLCAVGVVLSAPVYAEVLGGCFVGAVIAALIPRRMVMSYTNQREAAGRGAFEATVAFQRVVGAVAVSAVILSSAFAQETKSTGEQSGAQGATFDVLIPVDNPTDATAEVVRPSEKLPPLAFVPKELLKIWRSRRDQQTEPDSLMESARYEMDWQAGSIRAEFVVHRLQTRHSVTLRFPFVSVPLAGANACLVDGQSRPVTVNEARDALLVEFPPVEPNAPAIKPNDNTDPKEDDRSTTLQENTNRPTTHQIVFSLLPSVTTEDSLQRVRLRVPPVLASHVVVKSPPGSEVEFPKALGEQQGNVAAAAWTARLGKLEEWSLELLRSGATRSRSTVGLKADVACLAELTPTALRQRYRVTYVVSSGEMNEVTWLLPHGVLLRDGDVIAEHLLRWSLERMADGRQRLNLEFDRPQTGEFVVDVAGVQPPLGTGEHLRWEPWLIEPPANESTNDPLATSPLTLKTRSFVLGVSCLPGFRVTTPIELDRTAPLNESGFAKSWGSAVMTRQPQVHLQLLAPSELTFAVVPLVPQRKVRQELLLKIGRQAFEWALYAEITTSGSPAFQHDLMLAPHFRADDASITEDEAERLVNWTQTDQRLSLFLRDSTTGIQNLVLQGRDAVPADGRLPIPTRWFAEAESTEFSLRVTHDPGWQVEVLDDQQQPLNPSEPGGAIPDQSELVLGKFRADLKSALVDVRLTPHQPAGHAAAWTQVSLKAGDSWSWRHVERLLDEGQITARIFWPATWSSSGSMTLSPTLKELARRPLPDGIELTVQSLPDVAGPRDVFFESQPAAPPADLSPPMNPTPIRITPPTSLDIAERTHHWLIADDLSAWMANTNLNEFQPLKDLKSLPGRLPSAPAAASTKWLQIPQRVVLELTPPEPVGAAPTPKLLWMDTTVWVADGAITHGRTWLLLQPNGLRELLMNRPEDVHWIAAFVGDRPRELSDESPQSVLRLDNLPGESLLWLSIFWRIDTTQRDRIVARRDARLPMPAETSLHPPRHDLTLISSGQSDLYSTRGARRVQDWDGRLARAANILQALPSSPTAMNGSLHRLWQLAESDLAEARQLIDALPRLGQVSKSSAPANSEKNEPLDNATHDSARERLQSVLADEAAVRARLGSTLATMPTAPIELWTSDAWRQTPNSWDAIADLDQSARLSVIVVDRRWLTWMIALLAVVPVILLFRVWLRWQTGEWLASHPYLAWACLGLIWWTCLAPSLIGFGLLVLAAIVAIRHRWLTPSSVPAASGGNLIGH